MILGSFFILAGRVGRATSSKVRSWWMEHNKKNKGEAMLSSNVCEDLSYFETMIHAKSDVTKLQIFAKSGLRIWCVCVLLLWWINYIVISLSSAVYETCTEGRALLGGLFGGSWHNTISHNSVSEEEKRSIRKLHW